jgi:hypothetical protein
VHPETKTVEYRLMAWTVWACLAALFYREVTATPTITFIGSFNLTVVEPVALLASAAFVANLRKLGVRPHITTVLIFAMTLIWALNLYLGMRIASPTAILSLRASALFTIFMLISTLGNGVPSFVRSFEQALLPLCAGLSVLLVLRLIFGSTLFVQDAAQFAAIGVNDGGRPLSTFGAFLLAISAVHLLARILRQPTSRIYIDHFALVGVSLVLLATGQGTANAAASVGMLVVLLFQKGKTLGLRLILISVIAVGAVFSSSVLPKLNDNAWWSSVLPQSVATNLGRRQGNLTTRKEAWTGITRAFLESELQRKLLGWPAGQSPRIQVVNHNSTVIEWNTGAHSMYFGTLLSHGAIGLACFVLILLVRAVSLAFESSSRSRGNQNRAEFLAFIAMIATYSYGYDVRNETAMVLAIALVGAPIQAQARRRQQVQSFEAREVPAPAQFPAANPFGRPMEDQA